MGLIGCRAADQLGGDARTMNSFGAKDDLGEVRAALGDHDDIAVAAALATAVQRMVYQAHRAARHLCVEVVEFNTANTTDG
jgi:hypothetical protein